MQGQKPPTTKAEEERLTALKETWCIPCAMDNWDGVPATIQHVLDESGQRLGHHATYQACGWHHLGHCQPQAW